MININLINQKIKIKEFYCKTDSELQYYTNQIGTIKGIKQIKYKIFIYLVEFLNYNRIWTIQQEFEFYNNEY